ncbi:4-hydroxy-tetrahydrodipicolinate synthase [Agathobaculum sp. TL06]
MYEKRLSGVVIPTITPMHEDGSIDGRSLAGFTEYLVQAGVDCLYPNGTNGESLLLSRKERETVAEIMVKTAAKRIPVFIQCGSMTTAETISHVRHAVKIGADGVGVMSPAFFPMDEASLFGYYSAVVESVPPDFPVYIYNIPGCTTSDVKPELLGRLMEKYENIAGIKYSCPDLMRIEDYLLCSGRTPDLLIGCDSLFLPCLMTGGVGTVTGPGAIFHERFNRLYRQYREGDMEGARRTQQQIVRTDRELAAVPGIPALKTLLKLRGIIENDTCRGPLRKLTDGEYALLERVLEEYYKEEGING